MTWQCRLVDRETALARGEQSQVGDMWFLPAMLNPEHGSFYLDNILSAEYQRDWLGKRPPICVVLPGGHWFNVDSQASGAGDKHGWTVTGEAPNITVHPSINCVGTYHGWLRNGVLSDDCEGRRFAETPP
ncbi:MAG: hypothetical protein WC718_16855 [Phycisphaerales bacterium]|jgi:hypothetical protein